MSTRALLVITLSAMASRLALASGPLQFCADNKCGTCPVQVTDAGTGYPNCVVYSTEDVFGNQEDFPGSEAGGFAPFADIPDPGEGCQIIVKSPAHTNRAGCGKPIGTFSTPVCTTFELDTTFMVQFCCGNDDCAAAGAQQRSVKFNPGYIASRSGGGGGGGLYLHRPDGTKIEPLAEGEPPDASATREEKPISGVNLATRSIPEGSSKTQIKRGDPSGSDCPPPLQANKRGLNERNLTTRSCTRDEGSWVADGDDYTRPADSTAILLTDVSASGGESKQTIQHSRTQTWTTSISASIGFADVLSLGVSFSQDYSCEVTDTESYDFTIPEGQTGNVGFTAYLNCQQGTYTCDKKRVDPVEVCVPYRSKVDGKIAGVYGVVVSS